jgi:serine/threonine protein kinase
VTKRRLDPTGEGDIGPYRFATRIAVGGMAEVFRALRRQSAGADRAVVLKRMLPALLAEPEWREMFEHEARLGMRIRHRNVVEVLDHDVDQDAPYLVLEYVFGVDLRRLASFLARSGRPMRAPLAVWVVSELLAGLHAVHTARDDVGASLRIVHRDVSPSNVFLSVHGDVKLGDLGIAQAAMRESPRTPQPRTGAQGRVAAAKGKLGYLAPEQVAGQPVDARSDVFAAATILAELLLGRPLFSGGTELGVLLAIRDADLGPLRAIASRLPPGLEGVLGAALAREPSRRTPDAESLRAALMAHAPEPDVDLRRELGALVIAALDAGEAEAGVDRTSLAHTREHTQDLPGSEPAPPPAVASLALDRALRDGGRFFDLESPGAAFGPVYEVRVGERMLGPWPYARVVQALRGAELDGGCRVRVDGGEERAIADVAELARHLHRTPISSPAPRAAMVQTGESWDIASRGGIVPVLVSALLRKETGLLLCERDGVRKEVYLDAGVPTFVASNRVEELLGERLVAAGVVDRAELDLALAVMPRFEGRLGDTIVALGLAAPLVIFRHIALHAREKLLDVFTWREGRAALHRRLGAPDGSFPLRLDAWDLIESGIARRIAAGLEPREGAAGRVLTKVQGAADAAVPERLRAVLDVLEIPRSLGEVEDALGGDRDGAYAAVLLLVEVGTLRWSPSAPSGSISG